MPEQSLRQAGRAVFGLVSVRSLPFRIPFTCVCVLLLLVIAAPEVSSQTDDGTVREQLRRRIEAAAAQADIRAGRDRIYGRTTLSDFYEARGYEPAWTHNGRPTAAVPELIGAVQNASQEGMRPGDYHLDELVRMVSAVQNARRTGAALSAELAVDLDLLCTDAFLLYGAHRLSGRVDPVSVDREWVAHRRSRDLKQQLEQALADNRIAAALDSLLPSHQDYRLLRRGLRRYRAMVDEGGWEAIPEGSAMERGSRSSRIARLRNRLAAEGYDISRTDSAEIVFDAELREAVMEFQDRHGLTVDGVVGPVTLQALNVPAERRAEQIALNMERWRWLPDDLGRRHVIVNIAGFQLDVIEDKKPVMNMRVIVGRSYRRTPVFSDEITYLVLNPFWHVPPGIAVNDILPEVKRDLSYLARHNMTVFSGWGTDARVVDPASVNWSEITAGNFPFRIRQDPGPTNPLGRMKFMFPNEFNVYLHDTPSHGLFSQSVRTFSSGCIRVERPLDLVAYLLRGHDTWTMEEVDRALRRSGEQTISLPESVPVHLLYWTSWIDRNGQIQFRDDIYGRDARLASALRELPPAPGG